MAAAPGREVSRRAKSHAAPDTGHQSDVNPRDPTSGDVHFP